LRFYLLTSASLGEPYKFSEKDMLQLQRNTYQTLWNVYSFFVRYANTHNWTAPKDNPAPGSHLLDRWILSRLHQLERDVTIKTDQYQIDTAARAFIPFVDDLSNWYVRRSRNRFQVASSADEKDTNDAFNTLYNVLLRTTKLLAPFMPFIAEEIYRNLTQQPSVHLEEITASEKPTKEERTLLTDMAAAREIVTEGLAIRAREGIKVRQPLARLSAQAESLNKEITSIIKDEVNIKELEFVKQLPSKPTLAVSKEDSHIQVALDTELNDELKGEGIARDIIRQGQLLRRSAAYALDDKITLILNTADQNLSKIIIKQEPLIAKALQADKVTDKATKVYDLTVKEDAGEDITIGDAKLHLGVIKP